MACAGTGAGKFEVRSISPPTSATSPLATLKGSVRPSTTVPRPTSPRVRPRWARRS